MARTLVCHCPRPRLLALLQHLELFQFLLECLYSFLLAHLRHDFPSAVNTLYKRSIPPRQTQVGTRACGPGREKQDVFSAGPKDGSTPARTASLRPHHPTKILRRSSSRRDRCNSTLLAFASRRCCTAFSCLSLCSRACIRSCSLTLGMSFFLPIR